MAVLIVLLIGAGGIIYMIYARRGNVARFEVAFAEALQGEFRTLDGPSASATSHAFCERYVRNKQRLARNAKIQEKYIKSGIPLKHSQVDSLSPAEMQMVQEVQAAQSDTVSALKSSFPQPYGHLLDDLDVIDAYQVINKILAQAVEKSG